MIKDDIDNIFKIVENKIDNILETISYYPEHLYHRTNYYKNVEKILLQKQLKPSCQIKKGETYCATMSFDYVSLTEGKCVLTGGNIQIVFNGKKLLNKNKIEPIYRKMKVDDLFLHELEWRNKGAVNFSYDDIEEIVLYKNYNPAYNIIPQEKRRLTIDNNFLRNLTQKFGLNYRVVDYNSEECNNEERVNELIKILGEDIYTEYINSKNINRTLVYY